MKRKIIFVLITFFVISFFFTAKAEAAPLECPMTVTLVPKVAPEIIFIDFDGSKIEEYIKNHYATTGELQFSFPGMWDWSCGRPKIEREYWHHPMYGPIKYDGKIDTPCDDDLLRSGDHEVEIIYKLPDGTIYNICSPKKYTVIRENNPTCQVNGHHTGTGDADDNSWSIIVSDINLARPYNSLIVELDINELSLKQNENIPPQIDVPIPIGLRKVGKNHTVNVFAASYIPPSKDNPLPTKLKGPIICTNTFEIAKIGATPIPTATPFPTPTEPSYCYTRPCNEGSCEGNCINCKRCMGTPVPTMITLKPDYRSICNQLNTESGFRDKCNRCVATEKHMWTAIGCVPMDYSIIIRDYVFTVGLGIAGGIAFLYFLYGTFLVLTCAGNHEQLEQAKQIIMSALSGLLLIIFSVFLLKFIGVDVLRLPGFS